MPSVKKNQLDDLRSARRKFSEGPVVWNTTKVII